MSQAAAIKQLDRILVDHIAAGEVVERPSSVVKELVENALDSGARSVAVDLQDGGLQALVVTDDGCGMSATDLHTAILRHATSKITCLDDLSRVATFGFRGEALSSIAAVSKLSITSRQTHEDIGHRLVVHGGEVISSTAIGCPVGTSVAVQELFYNTPARRKFMRAPATEQAHVHEVLLRVAIGCRRAGLILHSGSRRLLDIPEDAPLQDRPALAFGRRQKGLTPFSAPERDVQVSGFVAPPSHSRRDATGLWAFVNGRYVRDRTLQRAMLAGYQTAFPEQFGTVLAFIDVACDSIDVNVHPQKLEVRFSDAQAIYQAVVRAVALGASQVLPDKGERKAAAQLFAGSSAQRSLAAVQLAPAARPLSAASAATTVGAAPADADAAETTQQAPPPAPAPYRATTASQRPWPAAAARPARATAWPARATGMAARTGPQPTLFATEQARQVAAIGLWQQLKPLAAQPPGFLCCSGTDDGLWLVRLAAARLLLLQHTWANQTDAAELAGKKLLLPPIWAAPDALQARADDVVIEAASRTDPYRVTLEGVGPGRFVVSQVPQLLADAAPVAVAEAFVAERSSWPAQPGDDNAWLAQWCQAIADRRGWPEQHRGTWTQPQQVAFLQALAAAGVAERGKHILRLQADSAALQNHHG